MISKNMRAKADAFRAAKAEFEQEILDEIVKVATLMNLDAVYILPYGNSYTRAGKDVSCRRIDQLDDLFCEHIHQGGFQGIWKKGKGWS